jgi:hypothetical protein
MKCFHFFAMLVCTRLWKLEAHKLLDLDTDEDEEDFGIFAPHDKLIAFDCGSSGTNLAVIRPAQCTTISMAAKNDKENTGCTISSAFSSGADPQESCKKKYEALVNQAKQSPDCFNGPCYASATAGNRLKDVQADSTGWTNFKAWAVKNKICSEFLDGKYTSGPKTLTIPGVMEGAMELETIISRHVGKPTFAFGSAGGSSAQFGINLNSANDPETAKKDWLAIVQKWMTPETNFKNANFNSAVDATDGDFLNTYTATDGSIWGVGSFLASDDSKQADPAKPIGGMIAMIQSLKKKLKVDTLEGVGEKAIAQAMADSSQGRFAKDVRDFMETKNRFPPPTNESFKMVANMHNLIYNSRDAGLSPQQEDELREKHKAEFQAKFKELVDARYKPKDEQFEHKITEGDLSAFTILCYAYFELMGFLPETPVFTQINTDDEYKFLTTAATLSDSEYPGKSNRFAFPLTK